MDNIQGLLRDLYDPPGRALLHLLDILVVAYLLYRLLALIRGTRAWRILGGVVIFVALLFLSRALGLTTLHWILDKATVLAPVALVILLLPELRQALEGFGKLGFWPQHLSVLDPGIENRTIDEIVSASTDMAASSIGALIVIERGGPLNEIVASGVTLNARISASLLNSIFFGVNPLHDGAVIVREDTLVAAACRLPLSESSRLDRSVHMRHRAAVGVTEEHDCLAIVVSEERGVISVASEGKLRRLSNPSELKEILTRELRRGSETNGDGRSRFKLGVGGRK